MKRMLLRLPGKLKARIEKAAEDEDILATELVRDVLADEFPAEKEEGEDEEGEDEEPEEEEAD